MERRGIVRGSGSCDLAVLVREFPKLSETFVLHDLLALEASGVRLTIFSLTHPSADVVHDALKRLRAEVVYLPELSGTQRKLTLRMTRALLFVRDPVRYLRAMVRIMSSPDFARQRVNEALLLAAALERVGSPPLYIHFAHRPGTVGRFASLLLGNPYAISAHAVDVWTPPAKELRIKVRDAEVVLCCYAEARDYLARLAKRRTPVELVHHGVELPPDPAREEASPPVVLAVGRLVEKKGFDALLRAAGELRRRDVDCEVRIAGDGPEWASLQRLANELGVGNMVRFLGPLSDREVQQEYARATVFALPCQTTEDGNRDGIPNTVLEAMARRVPVVSTTLASVREAVQDGVHGILVAERDHVALADAIARLLADPELRRRMGEAARGRVAERFDREVCAPRVFEALDGAGLLTTSPT